MILGIASPGGGRSDSSAAGIRVRMWVSHVCGGLLGGATTAAGVWLLATPIRTLMPRNVSLVVFVCIAIFAIAWDTKRFRPQRHGRQVPAKWIATHGAVRGYAMYGAVLGSGLLTYIPVGATYVVFAGVALLAGLPSAIVAGAAFGAARAGLVGPAALAAATTSKLLYRSRASQLVLPRLSALGSAALLALAIGGRVG